MTRSDQDPRVKNFLKWAAEEGALLDDDGVFCNFFEILATSNASREDIQKMCEAVRRDRPQVFEKIKAVSAILYNAIA